MDVFGKAGPSLVHTTCSKGIYVDSGPHHMFQKKGPTYKERMDTQQETLAFCYKYGATLDDMSTPFPNPLGMNPDGVRNPAVFHGHVPLGMTLINGHLKAAVPTTYGANWRNPVLAGIVLDATNNSAYNFALNDVEVTVSCYRGYGITSGAGSLVATKKGTPWSE